MDADSCSEENQGNVQDTKYLDAGSGNVAETPAAGEHGPSSQSQVPMKFDRDLFDAEDSDEEGRSDKAESEIESEESLKHASEHKDEDFNEKSVDPKILKKLQKIKGAAKKERENKPRCKTTKNDLFQLHCETQRLIRESHISLPYHKPEPKSLKDFMVRANKKKEIYQTLRFARDIEKAVVIQEKIAEATPLLLPVLKKTLRSSDSGVVSCDNSQNQEALSASEGSGVIGIGTDNQTGSQSVRCVNENLDYNSERMTLHSQESQERSADSHLQGEGQDHSQVFGASNVDGKEGVFLPDHKDDQGSLGSHDDITEKSKKGQSALGKELISTPGEMPVNLDPYQCLTKRTGNTQTTSAEYDKSTCSGSMPQVSELHKISMGGSVFSRGLSSSPNYEENSESKTDNEKDSESADGIVIDEKESFTEKAAQWKKSFLKAVQELQRRDVIPRLGREHGEFVVLEDITAIQGESMCKPLPTGVQRLMDRLHKQNVKKPSMTSTDVAINIVEKEESGVHDELRLKTVTYRTEVPSQTEVLNSSGGGLEALKQRLQAGMRQRRTAAYARRLQLHDMENEEGYDGASNDGLHDQEEAEMTDESDTDFSEDEGEECDGSGNSDEDTTDSAKIKKKSMFIDDEASEDSQDGELQELDDENESTEGDEDALVKETNDVHLQLESSDDEEVVFKKPCPKIRRLAISDDEDSNDTEKEENATAAEGNEGKGLADLSFSSDGLTPWSRHLQDTQPKVSSLTLPVEDSQDLYGGSQSDHINCLSSQPHLSLVEESMSQILDADGYLKVATLSSQPARRQLLEDSMPPEEENMDELMGLCSGQFMENSQECKTGKLPFGNVLSGNFQDPRVSSTNLKDVCPLSSPQETEGLGFGSQSRTSQNGMAALLDLCSGKFTASSSVGEKDPDKRGMKRRLDVRAEDNLDDSNGMQTGPFQILSDDEISRDSNEERVSEIEENEDGKEEEMRKPFKGFVKQGKIRRKFVEEEAELSGSDAESDEDDDVAEEDDYLEEEEGDADVQLSEEQLRDQVGRVHMKQMLDDDARELLHYQEMYLPDGDLHAEGTGRQRRFHWKNMDEGSREDIFANGSDEENQEDADEKQWRIERHERERFLEDQQEHEKDDTDSQFTKFGKFFLSRKSSDPPVPLESKSAFPSVKPGHLQSLNGKTSPSKLLKPKVPKRGSFLARSKESLARIAEMNKPTSLNVSGSRTSRNFVFQVGSPEKGKVADALPDQAIPAADIPKSTSGVGKPPAKKMCLKREPKPQKSIFKLLEK